MKLRPPLSRWQALAAALKANNVVETMMLFLNELGDAGCQAYRPGARKAEEQGEL